MRWTRACVWVGCSLLAGGLIAARADTHSCGEPPEESHYVAQPGDTEDAQHFAAERVFNGEGRLELNMCSGELHIERGQGDRLKLRIEIGTAPSLKMRAYVKTFDVAKGHSTISLEFPRRFHPVVVLELPSSTSLKSEINLGAGRVYFDANGVRGDRELNLGAGSAHLRMAGDHDYSDFEANVGMGSFHDHRPGGASSHFIISREYQGAGEGRLEMNVGAGSIDIDPVGGTI
ncbi:MAG TPA: hypothetical protein VF126_05000 [Acidobacteriaceae bacterium]